MIQTHAEHPSLLNLPTELFDIILNYLSDYMSFMSSLRSCCLVSRAFLPTAQALLFRRVVLHAHPLRRPHLCAGTKLRHLLELSHLLSHTREFQIIGSGIGSEKWLHSDPELLPALEAFISLKNNHIRNRSALQYVSLVQINWDMLLPNSLDATLQRLLAIESVTHIMISWSHMVLNIFEYVPSRIKTLEQAQVTFQNSGAADDCPKLVNLPAICLESLVIGGYNILSHNSDKVSRAIFNNLSRGCDGTSIRTLRLDWFDTYEIGMYPTFAPHVEKLTLGRMKVEQEYTPFDFSQFSRLQYFYMSYINTDRQICWLAQSLKHLKIGSSFRSITLTYLFYGVYDILAWAELDSILAGSQFEADNFSGMTIILPKNVSSTGFYSRLPRTTDKKLLKVVNRS